LDDAEGSRGGGAEEGQIFVGFVVKAMSVITFPLESIPAVLVRENARTGHDRKSANEYGLEKSFDSVAFSAGAGGGVAPIHAESFPERTAGRFKRSSGSLGGKKSSAPGIRASSYSRSIRSRCVPTKFAVTTHASCARNLASSPKKFPSYNAHNLDNEALFLQISTSGKL
jgi:hypothetical protein